MPKVLAWRWLFIHRRIVKNNNFSTAPVDAFLSRHFSTEKFCTVNSPCGERYEIEDIRYEIRNNDAISYVIIDLTQQSWLRDWAAGTYARGMVGRIRTNRNNWPFTNSPKLAANRQCPLPNPPYPPLHKGGMAGAHRYPVRSTHQTAIYWVADEVDMHDILYLISNILYLYQRLELILAVMSLILFWMFSSLAFRAASTRRMA